MFPNLIALLSLGMTWIPFAAAAVDLANGKTLKYTLGSISLQMDGLGLLLAAVALGLGTCVVLYSGPYLSRENGQEKFYAMLVLMISMIIGLGCATDLFNLWIWFEAMAITSYLLVAFYRERPASLEAGYQVPGSERSRFGPDRGWDRVGLGGHRLPGAGSDPSYDRLIPATPCGRRTVRHRVWRQSCSGSSAHLAAGCALAGPQRDQRHAFRRGDRGRVLWPCFVHWRALYTVTVSWPGLLIGFAIINMLVGNLMALQQKQVKRLLAYSSVAQVGYMLLGLGITFYRANDAGAQGSLFHLFNHALMKGLAFLSAGALLYTLHIRVGDHEPLMLADLAGAARRYPLVALSLSTAVLALGGLPPLAGFMSEWQIFVAGFQTSNLWIELAVVFAALNSVLSLAYYAPLVNAMYRLEPSSRVKQGKRLPLAMSIPLVVAGLAVVLIGIWPSLMNWLTVPAGQALLTSLGRLIWWINDANNSHSPHRFPDLPAPGWAAFPVRKGTGW